MAALSSTQVKYMLKITNRIKDLPISEDFYIIKDYSERIKKPMDIKTVLSKLQGNEYTNIEKWKEDMNQIWKNTQQHYTPQTLMFLLAQELSNLFKQLAEEIPKNNLEEWRYKVKKQHQKLMKIAEAKPEVEKKQNTSGPGRASSRPRFLLRAPSQNL